MALGRVGGAAELSLGSLEPLLFTYDITASFHDVR